MGKIERLEKYTAAAVQASPVFLDLDGTVNKAVGLIKEPARRAPNCSPFPKPGFRLIRHGYSTPPDGKTLRRTVYTLGCMRIRSTSDRPSSIGCVLPPARHKHSW